MIEIFGPRGYGRLKVAVPVIPLVAHPDWDVPPAVGRARSLTEARRLVRSAGYRINWAGTHKLSHFNGCFEWVISVHPPKTKGGRRGGALVDGEGYAPA